MPFPSWESGAIGCATVAMIGLSVAALILWLL